MGDTHPTPAENTSPISAALEGREVDPAVLAQPIDARMKALLQDHQEMGARPKRETDNGDLHEQTMPLRLKGHSLTVAEELKAENAKPASKPAAKASTKTKK